ncbi:MAG: TolC family protein, partial [Duncaniella sp.]|nr:TolC family protein [Duncaniella sp.]
MKCYSITTALLVSISFATNARTWSYNDCVEYAREHNISLQKSRLTEETSAYNLEEAQAQWQPSLDFSTSHNLSNYPW